jgi:hypothetical protein
MRRIVSELRLWMVAGIAARLICSVPAARSFAQAAPHPPPNPRAQKASSTSDPAQAPAQSGKSTTKSTKTPASKLIDIKKQFPSRPRS